jgi:plastocyanin
MKDFSAQKLTKAMLAAALAVFVGIPFPGCSRNDAGGPRDNEVWIEETTFNPSELVIAVGTTVTWTNRDNVIHTVTSGMPEEPSYIFSSGNMGHNSTFSFTFDAAGIYDYYCQKHDGMAATIAVK